jgi:MFS superfamily sulfate permease-like transporter
LLGQQYLYNPDTGGYVIKYRPVSKRSKNIHQIENVMIVRFEEGLFFGNVGQLKDRLKRIEIHGNIGIHPGEEPRIIYRHTEWDDSTVFESHNNYISGVIFDMRSVSDMDARYFCIKIVQRTPCSRL